MTKNQSPFFLLYLVAPATRFWISSKIFVAGATKYLTPNLPPTLPILSFLFPKFAKKFILHHQIFKSMNNLAKMKFFVLCFGFLVFMVNVQATTPLDLGGCDVQNQEWLNDALSDEELCNLCIAEVNVYQIGDTTYIGFIADNMNCADALTTIYYCDGTERCRDGGFAGFTECEDWFAANPVLVETLWVQSLDCPCDCPAIFEPVCGNNGITYSNSCFAECDGITQYEEGECEEGFNCDAFSLPWLDSLLTDGSLCTACIDEVNVYQMEDTTYIGLIGTIENCSDALTLVYNCDYELVCQEGGIAGFTECTAFFGDLSAFYVQTLWTYDEDCGCICPEIYEPVCGVDSITYDNSCYAECAGIFDYTPGECVIDNVEDILNSDAQIYEISPNPTSSDVLLHYVSQGKPLRVELFTALGIKVLEKSLPVTGKKESVEILDLSNLGAGIYFIKAGNTTLRVVRR